MSDSSTDIVQLSNTENMKEHPNTIPENAEHAEDRASLNDSEYDSAASYSEEEEEDKVRSRASDQDSQFEDENIVLERESGDGQESVPSKKIDDDEDKKNPQYIPKKGTFYEHDDRTADEPENPDVAENEKNEKDGRKKVWQDKKEKWSHDRFNESEQTPKSRAELIQIYGYDIRNEDGPPRARRRRRYGRGPNKYTRNWEDEEAYNRPPQNRVKKPLPPPAKKNVNAAEEFPPLGSRKNKNQERNFRNKSQAEKQPQADTEQATARQEPPEPLKAPMNEAKSAPPPANKQQTNAPREQPPQHNQSQEHHNKQQVQRVGSGRVVKPQKEIKDSDYKGFTTKTRQYRSVKTEQKILPKTQKKEDHQIPNSAGKSSDTQDLEKDFCKMNLQEGSYKGNNKHSGNRLGSVPPRLQSEQKGSKRYSSIRQRSLPETTNPPFTQHSTYYTAEYSQAQAVQPQAQPLIQSAPVPQGVPSILPAPIQIGPQQVPVTATPILQGPPQYPGPPQFPQQQFLQPTVAPPPFIAQQQPQLINYVQSQPQFPQTFQGYQQQFTPIVSQSLNILETQPPELYQPQGGITYYSADQQIAQRSMPQKRPKAAIPIVAPPSQNGREGSKKEEEQMIEQHDHPTEHNSGDANYVIEESLPVSYVKETGAVEEQ